MARPCKCRCICALPEFTQFGPEPRGGKDREEGLILLGVDEFEVIRLIDYMGFTQEQCAERMNVARTTVARMYDAARCKIAEMLVRGKKLAITGSKVTICKTIRPECAHEPFCCHRKKD